MKFKKILTVAALAMAGAALVETSASAQVHASVGDLVLSFDVTDGAGTGATQDYEVDIGSYATYAAAGYSNSNITPLSLDLSSLYGSNWASRGDLEWSVAGTATSGNELFVGVSPDQGAPNSSSSLQGSGAGDLAQLTNQLNNKASTTNNSQATAFFSNTDVNGFTKLLNNANGASYGYFQDVYPATNVTPTDGTPQNTTADLFDLKAVNGVGKDIGTFTLSSSGVLSFQSASQAVPEPSAYALGICAVVLFWVLKRRRSVA